MTTELETSSNELLLALRLRDVPGPRIAEALAEVQSHVGETGEEALEALTRLARSDDSQVVDPRTRDGHDPCAAPLGPAGRGRPLALALLLAAVLVLGER